MWKLLYRKDGNKVFIVNDLFGEVIDMFGFDWQFTINR